MHVHITTQKKSINFLKKKARLLQSTCTFHHSQALSLRFQIPWLSEETQKELLAQEGEAYSGTLSSLYSWDGAIFEVSKHKRENEGA